MPMERQIVKRIRELLNVAGAKIIKTSGEGEPDLVGSYKGYAVAIEVKQPGKHPTNLQMVRLSQWRKAGAIAFYTDFPAEALQKMQREQERRDRKRDRVLQDVQNKWIAEYDNPDSPFWTTGDGLKGFDVVGFFESLKGPAND